MKRLKHSAVLSLIGIFGIVLAFLYLANIPSKQERSRDQALVEMMMSSLSSGHFSPPAEPDELSARAFTLYLKNLDSNKRFFTQEDLAQLEKYRRRLDDEIKEGAYQFFRISTELWQERIREVQAYTGELLAKPLDLEGDDFLEVDAEQRTYPRDRRELKELWRKIVKQQTLAGYLDLLLAEAGQGSTAEQWAAVQKQPFRPELEEQARAKVEKDLKLMFNRLLQKKTEDLFDVYLNALAQSFDPHTNYLAPKDKEDFEIEMTGTLEGIGATLQSEGEYIKVVSIEPGGPSWRQGQLKAGDLILKVGQGEEEPVDLANMPLDDAVRLIRGPKGTEVRLTVQKPDGQIVVIPIIRDVVVFEAKFAQSIVIEQPAAGLKIGYITLPSFYHDYSNAQGRTAAGDLRKELEKLKKEGVNGVILDLRNNGGGALVDAVETAGLFIGSGPVVQVKDKKGKIRVYRDPDPAQVYAGPLVVMINSFSASASEIVAAALQDYGRAVIVGSPSSYGKGTVQEILDLDSLLDYYYPRATGYKPLGALKLTIEKFYRINGGSTQYKGVSSDVVLPDPYAYLEKGEQTLDYALPWDQVKPLNYKKSTEELAIPELRARSAQRLAANPNFTTVQRYIEQNKADQEQSRLPLQWKKFIEAQRTLRLETKKLDELKSTGTGLVYRTLETSGLDPDRAQIIQEWLEQLRTDFYLEETIWIMTDLIEAGARAEAA